MLLHEQYVIAGCSELGAVCACPTVASGINLKGYH